MRKAHARSYLIGPLVLGLVAMLLTMVMLVAVGVPAQAGTGGVSASGSGTGDKYDRLWREFSDSNKAWARRTGQCESGNNPTIHGGSGSFHGAFQFMLGTWRSSPKTPGGDPHKYRWKVQAVVAVYLKKRDGASTHWPVCG